PSSPRSGKRWSSGSPSRKHPVSFRRSSETAPDAWARPCSPGICSRKPAPRTLPGNAAAGGVGPDGKGAAPTGRGTGSELPPGRRVHMHQNQGTKDKEGVPHVRRADRTVLTGARVVLPTGTVENGRLVVEDGRIAEDAPVAGAVLDLTGHWVVPGFVDL